jgi:crossover junction endodeoxyribonuclease RusA
MSGDHGESEKCERLGNRSSIEILLPFPPSVNQLWRRVGARTILSRAGRLYRDRVTELLAGMEGFGDARLEVEILVHPPDRRRRDLDNLTKASLDAIVHGGLIDDDSQIDRLVLERAECKPGGLLVVTLRRR